jgi:drug/metabolite transporter (DMT)-like permease
MPMPPLALALVITAALLHALWNVVAKHAGGGAHLQMLSALGVVVLWAPVAAWFGWRTVLDWDALRWGLVLASAVVHLVYFRCLLRGYRESDLTVVYPVARGSGPLITCIAAVFVLGERPSAASVLGVLAVCIGIVLIAGGPKLWRRGSKDSHRVRLGIAWGAATGALIAAYTVIDGYAVKVALMSPILLDYFGNLLRVPFLLPQALRDRPGLVAAARAQWRHALVIAALGPLGYVLVLYAMTMAPLSHVAPARELSMLFVALLGGRLLGEGDPGWRLAGAACMATGVVCLALA